MSNNDKYTKWVSCWGNATSITDRKEAVYAKDITLRYPIRIPFSGKALRLRLSNLTGTEDITITKTVIAKLGSDNSIVSQVTLDSMTIGPNWERDTPEIPLDITAGDTITVSLYLGDYTQMNAGTLITGPLSTGQYAYGDYAEAPSLPLYLSRKTNWFYFLNTIDILTEEKNHAIVCYGDSITAQSWPDYLAERAWQEGKRDIAIIRRAVSGTRILRQYDCITYQAYGLKGSTRFPIEMDVRGMSTVIIQHGINDIIHPVGIDVNPFRPWSDMPTMEDMQRGMKEYYVDHIRQFFPDVKVYCGTLLPIYGWRTYTEEREKFRTEFNQWLIESSRPENSSDKARYLFDGCIDFDKAVRDPQHPEAFAPGFDSGDHLHPSEAAYKAMAQAVTL